MKGEEMKTRKIKSKKEGKWKLWTWFGIGRNAFCVMPRVMMHDMPDEWQSKMADLMNEWDDRWKHQEDIGCKVLCVKGGRFMKWNENYLNYRHPNQAFLDGLK